MFLFSFFSLSACLSLPITEENWSLIVNNADGTPVFLKAWASWCPHCKELAPVWDELANESKYEGKVIFADIECESNRKMCQLLPGENYPRLYWIEPSKNGSMIKYEGERSISIFENFIHKQFTFPLEPIEEKNLDEYLEKAKRLPTFVFTISPKDSTSLSVARDALESERNSSNMFLLINGEDGCEPSLIVYSGSKNVTFKYSGKWTTEALSNFVVLKSVRFLRPVDGYVLRYADNHQKRVFIVAQSIEEEMSEKVKERALTASQRFIVSHTNCNESSWFCRYTDIHPTDGNPVFMIYSRAERHFWIYSNETINFNDWLLDVYNNNIKGDGPGTGWLNVFKKVFFESRAEGKKPPYVLFLIPVFFIGMIIYMIIDSRKMNEEKEKKE